MQKTLLFAALQTGLAGTGDGDAGAEWTQGELCKFKTLHPHWNANDGDAPQQSNQRPAKTHPKTTKHKPEQIAE